MMMGRMMEYNGDWDQAPEYMKQMMQSYYAGISPFGSVIGLLEIATRILVLILIATLIRYFWKKSK